MSGLWAGLAILGVIAGLLWRAKKAGKDTVRAEVAEDALEKISKANAPFSDPDLQRVREKWRRD